MSDAQQRELVEEDQGHDNSVWFKTQFSHTHFNVSETASDDIPTVLQVERMVSVAVVSAPLESFIVSTRLAEIYPIPSRRQT
jgi:hypothetical protein